MSKIIKSAHIESSAAVAVFTALPEDIDGFNPIQQLVSASDAESETDSDISVEAEEIADKEKALEVERLRLLEDAKACLIQAQQDADRIRREAEEIAQKLLEEAKHRALALENEAYEKGFEQGKKDGEELGRKTYEVQAERLKDVIDTISHQANGLLASYEPIFIDIVLNISKALVHHEIDIKPEIIRFCLEAALDMAIKGMPIRVHLNSEDLDMLQQTGIMKEMGNSGQPLEFMADSSVERGGCLLEMETGVIDATMATKWRSVSQAILDILNARMGQEG